ncbi:MAG: rhomboid family intramembrane serine protease [Chloroflexi bacterium]|nr:rhomboid family intramembrane serine protease [Chloroflexota bacterium]
MNIPPAPSNLPSQSDAVRVQVSLRYPIKRPLVTYVILAVTIASFGLQYLSQTLTGGTDWLYILGGKINELILAGQFWRLITPVLLHASLLHIGFNMYALYSLGPSLERHYGHGRFFLLYLIAGFSGNALSFIFSPNPSLGASTAVFGLVAAEAVFVYKNQKLFGVRARSILTNLGVIIVVNLVLGVGSGSGIDNWGHLGGLAGGLIFAWVAGPIYQVQPGGVTGFELFDSRSKEQVLWGAMLSAGIFLAAVIGRLLVG